MPWSIAPRYWGITKAPWGTGGPIPYLNLKGTTNVTNSIGNLVERWDDYRSNGLYVEQLTGGLQPTSDGTKITFDGGNKYLDGLTGQSTLSDYSIVIKFKTSELDGVLFGNPFNNANLDLFTNTAFTIYTTTGFLNFNVPAYTDNQEHVVIITFSKTNEMKLYFDGVLSGTQTYAGLFSVSRVAGRSSGSYNGSIYDIQEYDKVLSPYDVTKITDDLLPPLPPFDWTPADLGTDLAGWYLPDDNSTVHTDAFGVNQLDDKSTYNRHTTQTFDPKKFQIASTPINGHQVLENAGVTAFTSLSGIAYNNESIAFHNVFKIDSVDSNNDCVLSLDGNIDWQLEAGSPTEFTPSFNSKTGADGLLTGGPYTGLNIWSAVFDWNGGVGGTVKHYINGVLTDTFSYNTIADASLDLIIFSNRGENASPTGQFCELIIAENVTPSTFDETIDYIKAKWNIT